MSGTATEEPTVFTVTVDLRIDSPIDDDALLELEGDEHGTAVSVGDDSVTAILTVDAPTWHAAAEQGAAWITKHIPGQIVGVEVLTNEEFDRRLALPSVPELVGISEIAEMLEVTRQRASALQSNRGVPAPIASLRSGPVWRKGDLSRFADQWDRKAGRPRRTA